MNKKKLMTTLGALSLAATVSIGGTIAYLTDKDAAENKFTIGKVDVELEEPTWEEEEHQDLQAGESVSKDPHIKNTGINDAYVYLEVQVPMESVITAATDGTRENGGAAVNQELFSFTPNANWTLISKTEANKHMVYVYSYDKILASGESTNTLFDTMTFANVIEGQVDSREFIVPVEAFAIQTANTGDGSGNVPSEARTAYEKYVNQNNI